MSLHVLVDRIRQIQQEHYNTKRYKARANKHVRVVALSPCQHSDNAPWVHEHEEGRDGSHHADNIFDTCSEGGDGGRHNEPESDGGEPEFLVVWAERARCVSGNLCDETL